MGDIANIEGQEPTKGVSPQEQAKTGGKNLFLKTETNSRRKESGAFPIDAFPQKVQPLLRETHTRAQDELNKASGFMNTGERIVALESAQQQRIDQVIELTKKDIKSEEKATVEMRLSEMRKELEVLKQAGIHIAQGKDAPELRSGSSPYDEVEYSTFFDANDVVKYGETRNILKLGKRLLDKRKSAYSQGRESFGLRQQAMFFQRSGSFERGFLGQRLDTNYIHGSLGDAARSLIGINTIDPNIMPETFSEGMNDFIATTQDLAHRGAQRSYYLDQASAFLKSQGGEVKLGADGNDLVTVTEEAKAQHTQDLQAFASWLKQYPKIVVNKVFEGLDPHITEHLKAVTDNAEPIKVPMSALILNGSSISLEMTNLLKSLNERVGQFKKQSGWDSWRIDAASTEATNGLIRADQQTAASEAFPNSDETLWHTTPYDIATELLMKGYLASRKFQIDKFGEAVFLNEGIKVGKDYVVVGDQKMTKAEYDKKARKTADQEQYQLAFAVNGPYKGGFNQARNGIAFVFSRPDLFSKTQFMEADGWHLFGPSFSWDNKDSDGFAIDVTKEPMMLVVAEPLKNQFEQFVTTELVYSPLWSNVKIDPKQWIAENVVYATRTYFTDPDDVHEAARSKIKLANELLNKKLTTKVPTGRFLPTGENGQTAVTGMVHLQDLFTYQSFR